MKKQAVLATVALIVVEIIYGFSFVFSKTALSIASPFVLLADRFMLAFLGLTAVMLLTGRRLRFNKNIFKLIAMAMFQPVLYFIFESYGLKETTSSFSGVMIALVPIVSMIAGIFVLREFPTALQYLFCAVSMAGVVIMTLNSGSEGVITPVGVICLFLAVVSCVAFNIFSRKLSSEFSVFQRTYAMTALGAAAFVSCALFENGFKLSALVTPLSNAEFLVPILYLGILSSVTAFMLQNYAFTYLPVAKTSVFANISTVVTVLAGVVFLKERLGAVSVLAIVMIIFGVLGVQLSGSPRKK